MGKRLRLDQNPFPGTALQRGSRIALQEKQGVRSCDSHILEGRHTVSTGCWTEREKSLSMHSTEHAPLWMSLPFILRERAQTSSQGQQFPNLNGMLLEAPIVSVDMAARTDV